MRPEEEDKQSPGPEGGEGSAAGPEGEPQAAPEPEAAGQGREFESLYFKIQKMTVAERISLALKGDKEARALLIKDSNKIIQLAVIGSPRLTEPEVASIAKSRSVHDEVLRRIGTSKEWLKSYEVRLNLVLNPRTPVPLAMKLVGTLSPRDLQNLAKSKNVSSVVAAMARKHVATLKK